MGRWEFHILWIPILFIFFSGVESNLRDIYYRHRKAKEERKTKLIQMRNDAETAKWLNLIVSKFWLKYKDGAGAFMIEQMKPILDFYCPPFLSSMAITTFDLGNAVPQVTFIKAYNTVSPSEIQFDAQVVYQGDAKVVLKIKPPASFKIPITISDVEFKGTMRIQLELIDEAPFIKTAFVSFVEKPKPLRFQCTKVTALPGISDQIESFITDMIESMMVVPKRIPIDLTGGVEAPKPKILRLTILGADNLKPMNRSGDADPYAMISCNSGGWDLKEFKTETVKSTRSPKWTKTVKFEIWDSDIDVVIVKIFDSEKFGKDRFMGTVRILLDRLQNGKKVAQAYDVTQGEGKLNVEMVMYDPSADPVITDDGLSDEKSVPAMLNILVLRAENLITPSGFIPSFAKIGNKLSPYVKVKIGEEQNQTKVDETENPTWEEQSWSSFFNFFVQDANHNDVDFYVYNQGIGEDKLIGKASMSLKDLAESRADEYKNHEIELFDEAGKNSRGLLIFQTAGFKKLVCKRGSQTSIDIVQRRKDAGEELSKEDEALLLEAANNAAGIGASTSSGTTNGVHVNGKGKEPVEGERAAVATPPGSPVKAEPVSPSTVSTTAVYTGQTPAKPADLKSSLSTTSLGSMKLDEFWNAQKDRVADNSLHAHGKITISNIYVDNCEGKDRNGTSDLYVSVRLLPKNVTHKPTKKQKTKVQKNCNSAKFAFESTPIQFDNRLDALEFKVSDSNIFSNAEIGRYRICLADLPDGTHESTNVPIEGSENGTISFKTYIAI